MAKSHGPISKMYGNMVDGKDEDIGEPDQDDIPDMGEFNGMHIDKGANGYAVHLHGGEKPQPPHFFSAGHPVAKHIHAILRHTKRR